MFVYRNDFEMLKQKFYSKDAPPARCKNILDNHGVRFCAMDRIPGWRPSRQTVLDFMHAMFLGRSVLLYRHVFDTLTFHCSRYCRIPLYEHPFCCTHVSGCGWSQFIKETIRGCNKLNFMAQSRNQTPKKCEFKFLSHLMEYFK